MEAEMIYLVHKIMSLVIKIYYQEKEIMYKVNKMVFWVQKMKWMVNKTVYQVIQIKLKEIKILYLIYSILHLTMDLWVSFPVYDFVSIFCNFPANNIFSFLHTNCFDKLKYYIFNKSIDLKIIFNINIYNFY